MRHLSLALLALVACSTGAADQLDTSTRADSAAGTTTPAGPARRARASGDSLPVVRGLYVNRWSTQSPKRMRALIGMADSTEVNALVLDLKDEFGLNYRSSDPTVQRNAGAAGTIPGLAALLDTMEAHGVHAIARIVVFKDSVAARLNPQHTIRKPDGSPWRDKEGLVWVSAFDDAIWEYNIRVAEELARMGFDEVQFDYIRFPEPYRSLPQQVFPTQRGRTKAQALAQFLKAACPRVRAAGALCTIDVFGLTTSVNGALEIGQHWETLSPAVDVVLPMAYPSHYPPGAFGVPRPNAEPYKVQYTAIARALERDRKLGITKAEHVRPWIQAFTLGKPPYGPQQVADQLRAVYDAGYDGWILWHPGSKYEPFLPALERTLASRKKPLGGATPVASATPPKTAADSTNRADSATTQRH